MLLRNVPFINFALGMAMLLFINSASFSADKQPGNLTAVSRDQVDEDFAFQGEYVGYIYTNDNPQGMKIGLQVIAQGDGRFRVLELMGGLPGNGWNGTQKIYLPASRQGSEVIVEADPVNVVLKNGKAYVGDTQNSTYGTLEKVERTSPTSGLQSPDNAIVLFDGSNTDHFKDAKISKNQLLVEGAETKKKFNNFHLHAEFRLPYMPYARGQARSNSGFYLQRRYEVQVLDSFGLESQKNDCSALYKTKVPDINMCYPPLQWQTYDIDFESAQFDKQGKKTGNAKITVRQNGILVHNQFEIPNKTGAGKPEGPESMPILIQNHRNPVRFRNIWIVEYNRGENPAFQSSSNSAPFTQACPVCPCP